MPRDLVRRTKRIPYLIENLYSIGIETRNYDKYSQELCNRLTSNLIKVLFDKGDIITLLDISRAMEDFIYLTEIV